MIGRDELLPRLLAGLLCLAIAFLARAFARVAADVSDGSGVAFLVGVTLVGGLTALGFRASSQAAGVPQTWAPLAGAAVLAVAALPYMVHVLTDGPSARTPNTAAVLFDAGVAVAPAIVAFPVAATGLAALAALVLVFLDLPAVPFTGPVTVGLAAWFAHRPPSWLPRLR